MRIWSLHPRYLDAKGLVALWRETLLAQHVLLGKTKGYKHHPQLERFREHATPAEAIGMYLRHVHAEACVRGYNFDQSKIHPHRENLNLIPVTDGQLAYELEHLNRKLEVRDPARWEQSKTLPTADLHPLFTLVKGPVAG